jgi:hypothetical protein
LWLIRKREILLLLRNGGNIFETGKEYFGNPSDKHRTEILKKGQKSER